MRSFITAVILFAVLVGGGVLLVDYIEDISDELREQNKYITQLIENDELDEAAKHIDNLRKYMDEKREIVSSTMEHGYADTIEIYICELEKYVDCKSKNDALARSRVLDMLFEHLPRNYRLKWENIL